MSDLQDKADAIVARLEYGRTIRQQADEIIDRLDRPTWTVPLSAIAETERFERMRAAHRELYDALSDMLSQPVGVPWITNAKRLLAKINGDTK